MKDTNTFDHNISPFWDVYESHHSGSLYNIFFKVAFNCTPTPFKFFFCVVKTHIVDLIEFAIVDLRFNIFICSLLRTYFLVFLQEYFIHCTVNNSIIIFLPVKFLSWYGIVSTVLGRSTLNILRTKVSKDLVFI